MQSKTSVIIVQWNVKDLLYGCLESLYKNTNNTELEVVVIDNASIDGSVDMVKAQFPAVRLIENAENVGFNRGTNQGIKASSGKYLLLLNSDVIVKPGAVDKMVEYMDSHRENRIGAIGCKLILPDGTTQPSAHHFPTLTSKLWTTFFLHRIFPRSAFNRHNMVYWDYDSTLEVDWLSATSLLVRREVVDQVGLLDERGLTGGGDLDWCFRIRKQGWKIVYLHTAEMIHFFRKSSIDFEGENAIRVRALSMLERSKADYLFFYQHYGSRYANRFAKLEKLDASLRLVLWFFIYVLKSSKREISKSRMLGYADIIKSNPSSFQSVTE